VIRGVAALGFVLLAGGCRSEPEGAAPLRVLADAPAAGGTTLTLVAAPGLRINARVKPALELPDGTVLRFDSPHRTADSSYFTQPPTTRFPGATRRPAGTLRASVCAEDELVCRILTLRL
jgi:hypothetical protein